LGKEHEGISEVALKHCDGLVSIPMYGFTESFNVSVAASLLTQTIVERIRKSNILWQFSEEEKENLYYEWIWNSIKYPDKLYYEWSAMKQ
jgi:tRNA (guanosine-2'-O-)-methyltransferase